MLKLSCYLKNPRLIILGFIRKTAKLYPDKFYIKVDFLLNTGKKLNLKNPKTFNEKLQWLKLYDRKPEYIQMVDKVMAKEYVAYIIGKEYIIPTLGVWDKFEDIDFNQLPNQFVLKTTHDSGGVVICNDKSTFDFVAAKKKLNSRLKRKVYYRLREWPYKNVKPRILAEKYMVDESGIELKDYKFFCFNGEVKYIQVDFNRFANHNRNIYDINWRLQNFKIKYPNDSNTIIPIPNRLDEMISIAQKLSKGLPHLRVDLYSVQDKIYFGELTFYHGSGFEKFLPDKWNYTFGSWIKLPNY